MWAWSWQPWKLYSEDSYFLRKTGRMRTGEATDTDRLRSMKARHLRNWPRPRRYILGGTWHVCLEGVECRMGVPETCVARYLRIQQLLRRYTICLCLEGVGCGMTEKCVAEKLGSNWGWNPSVWVKSDSYSFCCYRILSGFIQAGNWVMQRGDYHDWYFNSNQLKRRIKMQCRLKLPLEVRGKD